MRKDFERERENLYYLIKYRVSAIGNRLQGVTIMTREERKSGRNIDFSSMIIGFLLAACLALALGAATGSQSEGPYQVSATGDLTAYVIDTRTGECWQVSRGDNVELGTPHERKSRRTSITQYAD